MPDASNRYGLLETAHNRYDSSPAPMRPPQRPDLFLPVSVRTHIGFVVDSPSWSAFDELQSVGQRLITIPGMRTYLHLCLGIPARRAVG